jgi:hypothetical protein
VTRPQEAKKTWEAPELVEVGQVADVVQGGDGKASASQADSGDLGKPPGSDN